MNTVTKIESKTKYDSIQAQNNMLKARRVPGASNTRPCHVVNILNKNNQ